MKKVISFELKRCWDQPSSKILYFLLLAANLASYLICTRDTAGISYQFIRSADENFILQGTEAAFIPYLIVVFLPFISVLVWSLSRSDEEKKNNSVLIVQRVGIGKYISGKVISIVILVSLITMVPLIINLILCHVTYPMKGFDSTWAEPEYLIGMYSYSSDRFIDMVRLEHPTLYNAVYILNYGIFCSGIALFGFGVSFSRKMENYYFVKVPVFVFVLYHLLNVLLTTLNLRMFTIQDYVSTSTFGNPAAYCAVIVVLYLTDVILILRGLRKNELV